MPLLAALGAGCALHPVEESPRPLVADDAWSLALPAAARDTDTAWWTTLDDPLLDALIERALAANLGLQTTRARVVQAEALLRQSRSPLLPQLDGVAEGSLAWDRENEGSQAWSAGGALAWELDLWGRLRAAADAQHELLAATRADREAARLLLAARVADTWYGAVEQHLQLELLDEQRELASTLVSLTELRFAQGDASAVDVLQQRSVLAEVETEIPLARARLRAFETALDVLLGQPPDTAARSVGASALPAPSAVPPLGVPTELLVHRPDLASLARRVVLTGFAGYVDPAMGAAGPAASLLGDLVQPLLDWGSRRSAVDFARAAHREALLDFSEAYLVAVQEVETTLWQEVQQRELLLALGRRVGLLERTVEGTRWRYSQGITDYLPVLTAVRELQEAQREQIERRRELVSLRIQLYRALGGAVPS